MAATSSVKSVAEQIVDVQRALAGPHPGYRPVHAKGIVCLGTFKATAEARRVSRAVLDLAERVHAARLRLPVEPGVHVGADSWWRRMLPGRVAASKHAPVARGQLSVGQRRQAW